MTRMGDQFCYSSIEFMQSDVFIAISKNDYIVFKHCIYFPINLCIVVHKQSVIS